MLFPTVQLKDFRLTAAVCVAVTLGFVCAAQAETTRIVAIGASNTSGYKVGASNAWPPVVAAICLRVSVSGGTSRVTVCPKLSCTSTVPFGVPRAMV